MLVMVGLLAALGAFIALINAFGSKEMHRIPGPDPGGHFPNGRSEMLPSPFNPGTHPLPDIEISDHVSLAEETRDVSPTKPREP